jgi:hypothetical protein
MIVLFTQNESTGQTSIVTIAVDDQTVAAPERCKCRRAGYEGYSCTVTAVERRNNASHLQARRYDASSTHTQGNVELNLARLAVNNPASTTEANAWPGLRRLSIRFSCPEDRAKFSGTPNMCTCNVRTTEDLQACLRAWHKGYLGEVQEFYRQMMIAYNNNRYENQKHVVNGLMS